MINFTVVWLVYKNRFPLSQLIKPTVAELDNTKMVNLIKYDGFKIDFNSYINRLSISKGNDWVSISPLAFKIWISLFDFDSKYEKVNLKQDGCSIEIIKLAKNSLLSISNKSFISSVAVTETEFEKIQANIETINDKIYKKTTKNQEIVGKRVKSTKFDNSRKRKDANLIANAPPLKRTDYISTNDLPPIDMSFMDFSAPPPYSQG